ncbi:hypothetical protein [Sporichthya polymorpha]|uniref:hypothetical protein n=1 Tax=Sporichthya polymorpha TaxID=35751 RepID=UPI00035E9D61|nr:hypothetical protein [Sporichthya polymorpha]
MKPRRAAAPRSFSSPLDRAPEVAPEPQVFELDDQVSHDQHGLGVVSAVEPTSVVVTFREGERRRFQLPCAKLYRL